MFGIGKDKTLGGKERMTHPAQTWTFPMVEIKAEEKEAVSITFFNSFL
jgi:hypothetical protein